MTPSPHAAGGPTGSPRTAPPSASVTIAALALRLTDWLVAPCCAYLLGGLPLVAVQRALSATAALTARRGRRLPLARAAAGLRTVLNYLPARLTAMLLIAAAPIAGTSPAHAARVARREQRRLAGTNDGWPVAAMAAALDRCLEQRGNYRLNPGAGPVLPTDVARAWRLIATALLLAITAYAGISRPARRPSHRRRR